MPQLSLLPHYGVISVTGPENQSYLQGQLTCDMNQLDEHGWLAGCHCDAKGKMWTNFLLTRFGEEICLVMHKGVLPSSLAALQKFGVFAKVEISDASERIRIYGQTGETDPIENTTRLPFATNKALLLSTESLDADTNEASWQLAQIHAGRPELEAESMSGEFVPQMLNQAELGAISFQKGCYIGQETVARMKYLGKQKRASFYLKGTAHTLKAGDELEIERNGEWRRAGQVVNAVNADAVWHLLAVLPCDANQDESYRVAGDKSSQLTIQDLPYELGGGEETASD